MLRVWEEVGGRHGKVCWGVGGGEERCGKVCWGVGEVRGSVERGVLRCASRGVLGVWRSME